MARHNDYGKIGEEKVYYFLLEQGYVVLERNWRIGRRELDFIALDGDVLVVIEVKTRMMPEAYPEELLSLKKKKNLLAAGAAYLTCKNIRREIRFDLILVIGAEMKIEHIPDAVGLF
ncbi:YraN family protein [uncultured Sanguibacteroides sp.]|uniref:YraN family protein n=1 Tax=uncultured Sanguibacteroides sp. TaxID=1635151 RepID=UPI0025FE1F7F|nr:YraN family protein [uncultured Sanguibacteroides sp.]